MASWLPANGCQAAQLSQQPWSYKNQPLYNDQDQYKNNVKL